MTSKNKRSAKRYARIFFNATGIEKAEDAIRDLKIMLEIVSQSKDARNFFYSPVIGKDEREKVIGVLAEKFGFIEETVKFLGFIGDRRAMNVLSEIARYYINIFYEMKRRLKATVFTPFDLGEDQERRLINSLKNLTDKDIEIEYIHDPELIGGMVIKVGSAMYDSSLRGQLNLLKEQLTH
jgi:ATP synthase F1 delta subunit